MRVDEWRATSAQPHLELVLYLRNQLVLARRDLTALRALPLDLLVQLLGHLHAEQVGPPHGHRGVAPRAVLRLRQQLPPQLLAAALLRHAPLVLALVLLHPCAGPRAH